MVSSGKLQLLKRYLDPHQAHIVRGYLEANDIDVLLFDEHHNSLVYIQPGLGGVRLMVPADQMQEALDLLADLEDES